MKKLLLLGLFAALGHSILGMSHTVNVSNFSFTPNSMTVTVGDTIIFTHGGGTHTTTSVNIPASATSWDSPITSANPTFIYVVEVPGSYTYECTPHAPNMAGSFTATVPVSVAGVSTSEFEFNAAVNAERQAFLRIENNANTEVAILIMDITGKSVVNLFNGTLSSGETLLKADLAGFNSGIYFVRMERLGKVYTRKVLLR